jgi:hypothetical protein
MDTLRYRSPVRGVNKIIPNSTPREIAKRCLADAGNNPDRAIALAGRHARGARLRATVVAIGDALLHGPAN